MIGVLYATEQEAAPFLKRVAASPLEDDRFPSYHFSGNSEIRGIALVCGMGRDRAREGTEFLVREHRVSCIVNPGISGAVRVGIVPGEVFAVSTVCYGDDPERGDWSSMVVDGIDLPLARLLTFDKPVFDSAQKKQAARYGDLVDMEGVAVVRACGELGIASYLVKGVSDFADDGGREMLRENLAAVSDKVARQVERIVRALAQS